MLKGCETAGYVIVSAAKAQILSCIHKPFWKGRQLCSKTTWVGSLECMQVIHLLNLCSNCFGTLWWQNFRGYLKPSLDIPLSSLCSSIHSYSLLVTLPLTMFSSPYSHSLLFSSPYTPLFTPYFLFVLPSTLFSFLFLPLFSLSSSSHSFLFLLSSFPLLFVRPVGRDVVGIF